MKYVKKALKLVSFVLIITLASFGIGFNAAIFPTFHRRDSEENEIELVEEDEDRK